MGKYVSWKVNIVTALFLVYLGFIGGALMYIKFVLWAEKLFNSLVGNGLIFWILMSFVLFACLLVFRVTISLSMYFGFVIGSFGITKNDSQNKQVFGEFYDNYTYDIFSFKPFFWRPKTAEELLKKNKQLM